MMIKKLYFLTLIICLISCGKDDGGNGGDGGDVDNENMTITQEQLSNLTSACLDQTSNMTLPADLEDPANYATDEYATEVFIASTIANATINTFGSVLLPSALATAAEVDGLNVFENNEAYTWGTVPEKFLYLKTENGYIIRQFLTEDQILGRELFFVDQNEDCTFFEIIQRVTDPDLEQEIGDLVYRFVFRNEGSRKYDFGVDLTDPSAREYSMRSFDDLSGDLIITEENDVQINIQWNTDGDGTWTRRESGLEVDSGTWTF